MHRASLAIAAIFATSQLARARADDWLAVWPACSIEDGSRPSLALLYPAPGLPAVVHAGDSLVARLRTPAALTPPPGAQQAEVLARYTAELRGSALQLGVDASERHRHVLPVMSVRPDAGDSLIYRMRIEIPAYVAPGTYAFALRSPFGVRSAEQAVRVLAPGAAPRIARLPAGLLVPPSAAGTQPVDLWLAGAAAEVEARAGEHNASPAEGETHPASQRDPTSRLSAGHPARVGESSPPTSRAAPARAAREGKQNSRAIDGDARAIDGDARAFDSSAQPVSSRPPASAARAALRGRESGVFAGNDATRATQSRIVALGAGVREENSFDPAPTLLSRGSAFAVRIAGDLWVRGGCTHSEAFEREVAAVAAIEKLSRVAFDPSRLEPPPSAAELAAAAAIVTRDDAIEVDATASHTPLELSVLLPFTSSVTASTGTLAFYPAAEPSARMPTAKLARWTIPAGAHAKLTLTAARPEPPLEFRPQTVRSGEPARLRILGAREDARVAFSYGVARTAYASPELPVSFSGPLSHPVRAQVFEVDGTGRVIQGHLWVEPHRPPNCAIARAGRDRGPAWLFAPALCAVLAMLKRRRQTD